MTFLEFVEGPLLWIAFLTFIIGTILRFVLFFAVSVKKDKIVYQYFNIKWIALTILRWLLPINRDILKNPVYTICGYILHFCLILVPIFYSAHVLLWEEGVFEWTWWIMPDVWADWMTLVVIAIIIFFILRRMISADVRILTTATDYIALVVTALPFVTGYFATHGTLGDAISVDTLHLVHVLSGELMLILLPFTKLNHYILFFLSRGVAGIEFGRRGYSI